jgi:hypothetical protein
MSTYTIKDITTSTDRYKLYTLMCSPKEVAGCIAFLQSQNVGVLNLGKELSKFIESLDDLTYLNIDVYEYTKKLLDEGKTKVNVSGNDVVAIHNLGILLEPELKLNAAQLLKEFSKSAAVVIIWENQSELPNRLNWSSQSQNYSLDFSDTQLKRLQYAL